MRGVLDVPADLPRAKNPCPQNWSGRFGEEKHLLPLPGFEPRSVQPSRYTDYATPALYRKALSLTRATERRIVGRMMNYEGSGWTRMWPIRGSSWNLLGGTEESHKYYHDSQ